MLRIILLLACLQTFLFAGEVKRLAGGMSFTEGPVPDGKGNIYYSDIPNNRIMKWDGSKNTVWREGSGGANGLKLDQNGNLLACEGGARRVTRISITDQKVTVLADQFDGKKLNSPNDLALDAKGGIYFTDPRYGNREGMELDKEAVYYIPPDGGKLVRVADDLIRPNGIHIDKEKLYIADAGGQKIYLYAMNADGTLRGKKEFAPRGSDGMKVDAKGNVYLTTGGKIEIFAPDGKPAGTIEMPLVDINGKNVREGPANLVFSGNTLFITARTGFYSVEMSAAGQP